MKPTETMDFHGLYERYAPHVRRFALFLCGNDALADDITSETFVRAWVAEGKIEQKTVKAYLFAIARNLYRDSIRRERPFAPLGDLPVANKGVQADLEIKSELRAVIDAMQELPEIDRAALLMRAHGDVSYDEIAQVLGLSVTNVRVKVHRARAKLMEVRRSGVRFERPQKDRS